MNAYSLMGAVVDVNTKIITDETVLQGVDYGLPILENYLPKNTMITGKVFYDILNQYEKEDGSKIDTYVLTRSSQTERTLSEVNGHELVNHMNHMVYGSQTAINELSKYTRDMYLIHLIDTDTGESAKDLPLTLQLDRPYVQDCWTTEDLETGEYNGYKYVLRKYSCYIMIGTTEETPSN